jgi:hypothetical protein
MTIQNYKIFNFFIVILIFDIYILNYRLLFALSLILV